jgi:hypothetical protein
MKRLLLIALLGTSALTSQSPRPAIREEQAIVVNRATEIWRLEWKTDPKPACGPVDDSLTCPCTGFAYGEAGALDLVRLESGREIDSLSLTDLFDEGSPNDPPEAILQRWKPESPQDFDLAESGELERRVRARPVVRIMQFADYDHDGTATEFFLQTGTAPCGKRMGVVVGLLGGGTALRVLGTALHPNEPLVLQKDEWEALRNSTGPIRVVALTCGDHGSDREIELELSTGPQGISVISRTFTCDDNNGNRVRLLSEERQ